MVYGGYLMRSNLEVRLAIALDTHRITWQYEAAEIELPDRRRYVPDFNINNGINTIVNADIIEVKDRKVVWRCAESLGLGLASDPVSHAWQPPVRIADIDLDGEWWSVLRKPLLASTTGVRVLVVGATTMNAAVILMHQGLVTARRAHPITGAMYRSIDVQGTALVKKNDILEAAYRITNPNPWVTDRPEQCVPAKMVVPLHDLQRLMCSAQEEAISEGAAA